MFNKILIANDGSEGAARILPSPWAVARSRPARPAVASASPNIIACWRSSGNSGLPRSSARPLPHLAGRECGPHHRHRGNGEQQPVGGRMPANLVAILIARNTAINPAELATALNSTREPAFKK